MKKILTTLFFLIVIELFGISNVLAANNPYKEAGPYGTNCTWYAWKMASEKAGVYLPGWGDAKKWYNDAKNDGYSVGTIPKANSIIVWGDWTSYGHVGYVERVEGNILYVWDSTGPCIDREDEEFIECMANGVSEESDKICYANAKRIACEYTISPSDYTITGYIYLDEIPKKTTTKTEDNKTTSSPKEEKVSKSSNANLSDIILSSGTIEFDKDITEYNLEVANEIEIIEINATLEDKNAKIEGTGIYELKVGLNEIKLKVTAENNSTKEYIIKVTRKEKIKEKINLDEESTLKKDIIIKDDKNKIIILGVVICVIIVLIIWGNKKFKSKKR